MQRWNGSDGEAPGYVQIERTGPALKTLIRIAFDKPELNLLHYTRTTPQLGPFLQNPDAKAMKDWFRLVW